MVPRTGWVIVGVAWIVVPRAAWNSLALDPPPWVRILGLAILLAATALTLWARLALGTMCSGAPTVKQLRTSGPYGVTRHPIYTGMLGMMLGSLLLAGGGRWILPFPVFLVLLEIKIRVEEQLMLAEFLAITRAIASGCPSWYLACARSAGVASPATNENALLRDPSPRNSLSGRGNTATPVSFRACALLATAYTRSPRASLQLDAKARRTAGSRSGR